MNASKFFASTAAAVAVAGAVGLAYAQTQTDTAPRAPMSTTEPAMNPDRSGTAGATGTTGRTDAMGNPTGGMATERAARADRN
ncbi:MAG: hypothetical protein H7125_09895 [Proteobacteria bacterium]|nr:hypothetical protein [Burkholderiales bacterium]